MIWYLGAIKEFRAKGYPLTFPLALREKLREKLREFPSQNFVRAKETHTDRQLFPWAHSPGNDKHISKMKNN